MLNQADYLRIALGNSLYTKYIFKGRWLEQEFNWRFNFKYNAI